MGKYTKTVEAFEIIGVKEKYAFEGKKKENTVRKEELQLKGAPNVELSCNAKVGDFYVKEAGRPDYILTPKQFGELFPGAPTPA